MAIAIYSLRRQIQPDIPQWKLLFLIFSNEIPNSNSKFPKGSLGKPEFQTKRPLRNVKWLESVIHLFFKTMSFKKIV